MSDLARECGRKAFHMLSLAYLAAYGILGYPRVIPWMIAWTALVVLFETARLRLPRLNEGLTSFFSGMIRPEESRRYSGIFHTTVGALVLMAAFGSRPRIVAAALCYVAFGDAAAALVGKSLGRRRIGLGSKTIEGSLACFAACALVGGLMGFDLPALLAGALGATAIEMLPTTRFFNDNLWMPIATAVLLRLVA